MAGLQLTRGDAQQHGSRLSQLVKDSFGFASESELLIAIPRYLPPYQRECALSALLTDALTQ